MGTIIGNIAPGASPSQEDFRVFETQSALNTYLSSARAKAGQTVKLLERNKLGQNVYQVYVLQSINNVLVPQKISSDTDFSDLDLKIVDDENDEDKKYLVLGDDSDDETEYARVLLPAMGGAAMGGGGGSYIVMRLRNLLPSTIFTVPYNQETDCTCELDYTWSSVDTGDNNTPTGNGTANYYVDDILVLTTRNLAQGNVVVNLGEYLTPNRVNVIKVIVVDSDNNKKSLTYKVNVKPNSGIPKTDLSEEVQTSLGKADTALQTHQDISGKADKATTLAGYGITDGETTSHKVTAVNSSASDTQYPSAKAVYTELSGKADKSNTYTKSEVDAAIQTAIGTIETQLSQV